MPLDLVHDGNVFVAELVVECCQCGLSTQGVGAVWLHDTGTRLMAETDRDGGTFCPHWDALPGPAVNEIYRLGLEKFGPGSDLHSVEFSSPPGEALFRLWPARVFANEYGFQIDSL